MIEKEVPALNKTRKESFIKTTEGETPELDPVPIICNSQVIWNRRLQPG